MKVLILAGGFDQIALIQGFKKRGYETVLVDYYDTPPAKVYAHKHYKESTLDFEAVLTIAKKEKVDLVTTACTDQALLTAAWVSEKLALPSYLSYAQALQVTNKMYMKEKMVAAGIPTSKYQVLENVEALDGMNVHYPVVIKPSDCNSSKGVEKAMDIEQAKQVLKNALDFSRSKTAILEEYMEGEEVSVDAFITHGKVEILLITKTEKIASESGFTINGSRYPSNVQYKEEMEIERICQRIADTFSLTQGPLLIQMILSKKGPFVIEFSARMGGGTKYKLIERLADVPIMEHYIDLVLGKSIEMKKTYNYPYASMVYCYVEPSVFCHVEGFQELYNQGALTDYYIYKTPGMEITGQKTSGDRVAGYLLTAKTEKEMVEKERNAKKHLKIFSRDQIDVFKRDV